MLQPVSYTTFVYICISLNFLQLYVLRRPLNMKYDEQFLMKKKNGFLCVGWEIGASSLSRVCLTLG